MGGGLWSVEYNLIALSPAHINGLVNLEDQHSLYRAVLRVLSCLGTWLKPKFRIVKQDKYAEWNAAVVADGIKYHLPHSIVENAYLILYPLRGKLLDDNDDYDNLIQGSELIPGVQYPLKSPCVVLDWGKLRVASQNKPSRAKRQRAVPLDGSGAGGLGAAGDSGAGGGSGAGGSGADGSGSGGNGNYEVPCLNSDEYLYRVSSISHCAGYVSLYLGMSTEQRRGVGYGHGGRARGVRKTGRESHVPSNEPLTPDNRGHSVSVYAHEFILWCVHGKPKQKVTGPRGESDGCCMHICNNKECLNPWHLWHGTRSHNMRAACDDNGVSHGEILEKSVQNANMDLGLPIRSVYWD